MFFNPSMIAIDIGSSAIKMVELTGNSDKKLKNCGLELLPKGVVENGMIQHPETVQTKLKILLKKMGVNTRGRRAAVSLGGNTVLIKRARFPQAKSAQEMTESIFYEAGQHFQHDINDLYFDFFEQTSTTEMGDVPIILVGAKRELVEQYISVVKGIGFKIGVVDCDVFSLSNAFEYNYGQFSGIIAMLQMGASFSQLSFLADGQFLYTRTIPMGGDNYSSVLAQSLNVPFENAEVVKLSMSNQGIPPQPALQNIIRELNDQIVQQVKETIDFFFQSGEAPVEYKKVEAIFLSGGASYTLGVAAAIAAGCNTPIELLNPLQKTQVAKKIHNSQLVQQSPLYANALGLALRSYQNEGLVK